MHTISLTITILLAAAIIAAGEDSERSARRSQAAPWWAFQPIRQPRLPGVKRGERVRNPIDRFVFAKLEEHHQTFSSDANRRTLIRRLSFDLIGLPPTPEQVDGFVSDDRADAYERLVDRLLASPNYGPRWARHWLDLVRYADTNGGGFDYVYPNAWQYRDYVVRAFNQDKPYDEFLIEQLAGDLLPIDCDEFGYLERLRATGFLTLAPKGLGMQDKELMTLDVVDDQIDVFGRALMGLTLSCARCHDHKFDPISTQDYYALAGIFRSTNSVSDTDKNPSYWPERPLEMPAVTRARLSYQSRKSSTAKAIKQAVAEANQRLIASVKAQLPQYLFAATKIRDSRAYATPVVYWPLDEIAGDVVNAMAGPDGRLANIAEQPGPKPLAAAGVLNQSVRFDQPGAVISGDLSRGDLLEFGEATDFTVSLWIKTAPGYVPRTADTVVAAKYSKAMWFLALRPGAYNGIYLRHYDGKRTVDIRPASNRLPLLTDSHWHHVVFTSDRDGNGTVHIDGEKSGEVSIKAVSTAARFSELESFYLGASTNEFRGSVDELAIWNRKLSAREIRDLYAKVRSSSDRPEQNGQKNRPEGAGEAFDLGSFSPRLVPSVVRSFVDLLSKAEEDPKSPLFAVTEKSFRSTADAEAVVAQAEDRLTRLVDANAEQLVRDSDVRSFYDDAATRRLAELHDEAVMIEAAQVPDPTLGMVAADTEKPADLRVHLAGDHNNLGEVVPRGFPEVIRGEQTYPIGNLQSGRLQLARWLTNPEHPLTARVIANRIWQWHFGDGLVRTSDNLGRLGEQPSHPELLDWLARRLIDSGWSVKRLQREIVLSTTYRQRSASPIGDGAPAATDTVGRDPLDTSNRLLWRMNRRRLEGEALRDAMLVVSGQIDLKIGGTINKWKPKMFSVDDQNAETANYVTARRSIYLPVVRGAALHEMLRLFDFADPNSSASRRTETVVPTQALFLMNSPFVIEQSKQFAERLLRRADLDDLQRIRLAYRLALAREPTAREFHRAEQLVRYGSDPAAGWRLLCQSLLCLNEFAYVD